MAERDPIGARARLSDFYLEVEGARFRASAPEWGDATFGEPSLPGSEVVMREAEQPDHVTIGLQTDEIGRLHAPVDRAVLMTSDGDQVLALKIEKVSRDFGVVVGVPLAH